MTSTNTCQSCQQVFACSSRTEQTCWCSKLPHIHALPDLPNMVMESTETCLCPDCLKQKIAKQIQTLYQQKSLTEMLEIAAPYAKPPSMTEHIDYSIENGFHVFSHWYHLKRGCCCGNGCKNCPYVGSDLKREPKSKTTD